MSSDIRWFALVLFVGHVGLLGLGSASLWHIAGGNVLGVAAAILFAVTYVVLWKRFLVPGSPRRLPYRERLAFTMLLSTVIVILGALATLWVPALIATSVVFLGDALNERSR